MTRRRTFVDEMMNEVTLYGGLPMRRCDVIRLATEHLGEHARQRFGADYFAMRPAAVNCKPLSLEVARRICDDEGTPEDHEAFAAAVTGAT